ncbi:MAG TPA: hypothetical protein VGS07_14615 [Thermoanaerobaculia bacterium]|jgi:hypothetical protein|nr:hypothetical protein [Thermoanaerobaculia bacterium]
MNGKKFFGMALLAAGLMSTAQQVAAADLWLHIDVNGKGDKGDQANINLPLSMVRNMAPMLEEKSHGSKRLHVRDKDLSVSELRRAWREIADGPDANYITVKDKDSDVHIGKQGDYLRLKAKDRGTDGEDVDIKVPLDVVAALFSSDGDELNFGAALEALARRGEGELVTVNGNDETVRIWVDSRSGGR